MPPPRMREQVLARAAATPQLPPARAPAERRPARWRAGGASPRRPPWSACSAAGAAATTYAVQEQRLGAERAAVAAAQERAARIQAVLAAPDAALRAGELTGGGRVTVVVSDTVDAGVVVLADAPAPGPDRAYQLWVLDGVTPISVGLLPAGQSRATELIEGVRGRAAFAVSLEPAGGSPAPYHDAAGGNSSGLTRSARPGRVPNSFRATAVMGPDRVGTPNRAARSVVPRL